jgi:DNA primase
MIFLSTLIPQDKISEIKNMADIVEIVSEVVRLKKAGRNFVGLCPFHSEKTPSFTVSPDKQIFYCFGCGAGGSIFSFLQKQEGLSFPEAVRMLSRRYGIDIPTDNMSPEQKRRISEREGLLGVNRQAVDFFQHVLLKRPDGEKARLYLKQRGFTSEVIQQFNLGYAPQGWDHLKQFFMKRKIPAKQVEKCGLIVPRKNKQGFIDRFRDRIIFPIYDVRSQPIGFGGRVLDDSLPKYLNSPETPLFNKSRTLYGLHMAKQSCRRSEVVYIVEGYFDLLALHQHGIRNSVATLGTSLTARHVQILRGFVGKMGQAVLVYDSDEAGIKAAERSIGVFEKEYVEARILVLPAGYDPDSYLFKFGTESLKDKVTKALGVLPFLMDSAIKRHGLSVEGKVRILSDLIDALASVGDSLARSLYIKELAERIDIDEAAVLEKVRETAGRRKTRSLNRNQPISVWQGSKQSPNPNNIRSTARESDIQNRGNRLERQIIAMMFQFPEILAEISRRNVIELFEDDTLKSIGQTILTYKGAPHLPVSDIITAIPDNEQRRIAAALAIKEDFWKLEGCLNLIEQFEASRTRREMGLLQKIKAAEEDNDHDRLSELLREKLIQARKMAKRSVASEGGKTI